MLRRPDVSFDGTKVLFCYRPEAERTFHVYEINVDGKNIYLISAGNNSR